MFILLHVTVALAGIIASSVLVLRPSKQLFNLCYGLVVATLASGIYLVIVLRAKLLETCLSGLLYLGVVSVLLAAARWRQATGHIKNNSR